jgi:N-acetylmuramoyl-L-alanine amidase
MLRNLRFLIAFLCSSLLIFSPVTENWAKAEEGSTDTSVTEPKNDEVENVCFEEDLHDQQPGSTASTEVDEQNPAPADESETPAETDNLCEEEPRLEPSIQGIGATAAFFTDVQPSYWAYANIQHLASLKVINGYENADKSLYFNPEEKVTRAQAAKMIIEAIGEKQASVSKQLFHDISQNHWAAGYVQRAYELNIFKGYENGNFGPNDTLKRSQMAKVIVEAYQFNYNGHTPSHQVFFDVNSKYWAYEYIEKMHYNGLSNGSNYRFLPEELISRAQFSAFLSRAMEPSFRLKVTGPSMTRGKVISKTALNIRSSASATSTILGKLTPGTMINITEINGFWAKIQQDGLTGYVHKSYLKLYSADTEYPLKGRIIVIDPGHGYKDPGASYDGHKEKDIVLSVGKKVAEKLKSAGAHVVMTREADTFLELPDRVKLAQNSFAELFVSIHVNSVKNNTTVNGTETYFDTSTNMNGAESRLLAYEIQKEIVERADMYNRGIKDSGFYVIRNNQIPAVLIELGFIPNKTDREKLISEQYQNIYAQSIYQGIKSYYTK